MRSNGQDLLKTKEHPSSQYNKLLYDRILHVSWAYLYYAQLHKDLDLASVRDWDRRANERLLTALAELPEPRLLEPDWWTFGRALGSVFDVDHDREHAQGIQRWVGQS